MKRSLTPGTLMTAAGEPEAHRYGLRRRRIHLISSETRNHCKVLRRRRFRIYFELTLPLLAISTANTWVAPNMFERKTIHFISEVKVTLGSRL